MTLQGWEPTLDPPFSTLYLTVRSNLELVFGMKSTWQVQNMRKSSQDRPWARITYKQYLYDHCSGWFCFRKESNNHLDTEKRTFQKFSRPTHDVFCSFAPVNSNKQRYRVLLDLSLAFIEILDCVALSRLFAYANPSLKASCSHFPGLINFSSKWQTWHVR